VEKPICYDLEELREARAAVLAHDTVVQVGTQRRSDGSHMAACDLIARGVLGKISRVTAAMNFNHARWLRDCRSCREKDVDWPAYLFNRPARPFDARLLRRWHLFRELTNGISGLWMSHFVDAVSWIMDDPFPRSAVAHGGVYVWKEDRQTSDTFHALLAYPKEWLFSFSMSLGNAAGSSFTANGTRGTLDLNSWTVSGAGGAGPGALKESMKLEPRGGTDHMKSFLECVFSRKKPTADMEAGWRHGVACVMAARALWTGRRQIFDPAAETIREG
jgi:predicted dehydrogenase